MATLFLGLSAAKLKEGIFVGTQIREIQKCIAFDELPTSKELRAWEAFKSVCSSFPGNKRVANYKTCIKRFLRTYYEHMGCRMSLKIHFLHSHLNFFPQNLGAVSGENGERLHQDIMKMEANYRGNWSPSIMGDFCWMLKGDIPQW